MPLPTSVLDDRHFQDIVDEAKRLIPRYCPEWTDHNVSDPGVAMIELFAWMTDMLLYRVNQVGDKNYVKFLELIGITLAEPHAAVAPITFYLSAPQPHEIVIPSGTEVATVRTETSPAIIFTTEEDLTVRPAHLIGALTRSASGANASWVTHDLPRLELPNQRIPIFPARPAPGDAFYLCLDRNHSHHVLALTLGCEIAGGAGVDPKNPPIVWQVWQGGLSRWTNCILEYDGTGGFNQPGEIVLRLPAMAEEEFQSIRGYWLRCRLTDEQAGQRSYRVSPDVERLLVETRGGTVSARHAVTTLDEVLGQSDGTPGQSFKLIHTPLLARDPHSDYLVVEPPGGAPEHWQEVSDFADSGPDDAHYTLENSDGTLILGPSLLQPNGSVYCFGRIPPRGSRLRFSRYQYGGGVAGNAAEGTLTVMKTSIPYVARVRNWQPATGGRDAQSLEDAKIRAPQILRTRTRAVTADDYEYLARQVPNVARARCLAPGAQPGAAGDPKPGQVFIIVLPQVRSAQGTIPPEQLALSAELRSAVLTYLNERRLVGTAIEVRAPEYTWVSVQAKLRLPEGSDPALAAEAIRYSETELNRYLNPYTGGPRGDGWPLGRDLNLSEIYGILQRVPSVEFVEDVQISVGDPATGAAPRPAPPRLQIPPHGLICSAQHRITA